MRRSLSIIISVSLFFLCTGCWDAVSIEARASAVALSFDWSEGQYEVGVSVPIPYKLGSSGVGADSAQPEDGVEDQPRYVNSVQAGSLNEAIDRLSTILQRRIYFGQTVILIFSREVAERGLDPITDYIRRNEEIRIHARMVVVEGKAIEFMKNQSQFFNLAMEELRGDLENGEKIGYAFREKLGKYLMKKNTIAKGVPILNMVQYEKDEFMWEGAAVFNRDKMVYKITDPMQTSILNQIRNSLKGFSVRIPCEKGVIAYLPIGVKSEVQIDTDRPIPKIIVNVYVDGYVEEKTCPIKLQDVKNMRKVSRQIASEYEKGAYDVIQLGKQLGVDLLELQYHMRMNHPELWKKYQDVKEFQKLPVEIHYDVKVRHYGVNNV